MTTFMAECFWPGVTEETLGEAGERLRSAIAAAAARGVTARYIGSILVPLDEMALCLFEAPSEAVARELDGLAAIPSERILPIVQLM